jgi:hypothetical protein
MNTKATNIIHIEEILLNVMYGCEAYSVILREQHTLKMREKSLPRQISDSKSTEVINYWRKLQSEEHSFNLK